jgi:transcriptional regulator with PAS, ATPase and Fis domain
LSNDALKYLYEYDWPGNVREIRNLAEMLVVTSVDNEIRSGHLPDRISKCKGKKILGVEYEGIKLSDAVGKLEKELIDKAYKKHGNVRDAAEELGISAATFVRKRSKSI